MGTNDHDCEITMLSLAGRKLELMVLNALVDGVGERGGALVLDQDWEEAFFVENCPGCFAVVLADPSD
jgi:hypothetical protein